ncbi:MAG: sigma 54-interacting transcriptional regulator [Lactococcus sp.]|nr:sigma-54-dependent transcriptional regulator [Lactococcus sp.]MDN5402748.1 sigma 54-interacting transcriptional regulator [Lactococcus sp.]MDN5408892.1 sigma 54-interacting transcriptional regulator [Lactococcus sp.]MDN5411111.1 sigma 54-interacting transcriptional regulator [Lactococcus sp.]MDN5435663.1 sigma 54-interacting transcriptional regulator [Lactococcus sp.]MDN5460709.1 sigma 54-interacting transcriptional regulator [Lactococcus sp.]
MLRIDRVYQALSKLWFDKTINDLEEMQGTPALELAKALAISRANTSLELNKLVRDGRVIKVTTYPVRFLPKEGMEALLDKALQDVTEIQTVAEIIGSDQDKSEVNADVTLAHSKNPFDQIIGYQSSLKKVISQAKAAVYYPPSGLHMLLLGQTGTGKTFFAEKTYEYSQYEGLLAEDAPFKSFNCADYYNNPQLLMSQLFGYAKGAFTGAESDREGLVEKADGGILLLDEVHRLPPEGQEMLFYFIDNGTFNRLGESGVKRHSKVLIICATTENPESALLKTFVRRIPMTIQIPSLSERSIEERVELTTFLFGQEAKRIKKTIRISIDVINALVHATTSGNVGQLKSMIQLVCAQAFLKSIHRFEEVDIDIRSLPEEIREDWMSSRENLARAMTISKYVDVVTVIHPEKVTVAAAASTDYNIYDALDKKMAVLEDEGLSHTRIKQTMLDELQLYLKKYVKNYDSTLNLLNFVDKSIVDFVTDLKGIAEAEMGVKFDRRFVYFFAMHIDAYFARGEKVNLLVEQEIEHFKKDHGLAYQVAERFKVKVFNTFHHSLPDIEVAYLAMLLVNMETESTDQKIGILVAAHGNSTATSMVNVVTELLGVAQIDSLDMSLAMTPQEMFEAVVDKVKKLNMGKGVLLLVDMGSLSMIEPKLVKASGIEVRIIQNVTTVMVLDAVRKAAYTDRTLMNVYDSVKRDFLAAVRAQKTSKGRPKAIVSICMTGSGTAKKVETLLNDIVERTTDEDVRVLTLSALKIKEEMPKILANYQVLASVGTKNPKIEAPYISLEKLIEGSGTNMLNQILTKGEMREVDNKSQNYVIRDLCADMLETHLVYLNPRLMLDFLLKWTDQVQQECQMNFQNATLIKLIIHSAFAFERVIKENTLAYEDIASEPILALLPIVSKTLLTMEDGLNLRLSQGEKLFICEILAEATSVS